LDRKLAERRLFPAIDIKRSGTRHEEKLYTPEELEAIWKLRRAIAGQELENAVEEVIKFLARIRTILNSWNRLTGSRFSKKRLKSTVSDIKVKLLSWTNDPEKIVGYAARICYSAEEPLKLLENLGSEQIQKSIRTVKKRGHLSVLEHASLLSHRWLLKGLYHQLVRHRLASYSQRSQRYVNEEDEGYVVPNTIAKDSGALEAYQKHIDESKELYKQLLAMGIPKEDARLLYLKV